MGHPLFLRLASNAFPDIGSVARFEKKKKKKKTKKKIIRSHGIGCPGNPG